MAAIFRPSANLWMKLAMLSTAALVVGGCGWWWMTLRTDWARGVRFVVEQPVPFSHQHHVAGLFWVCILIGLTSVDFLARQDFPARLLTRR